MRTSYEKNNYGGILRTIVLFHKPKLIVECGVLDGYSAFHIAHALRYNDYFLEIKSRFYAYDLWDDYEYKHGDYEAVRDMILKQNLEDHVILNKGDAFEVVNDFDDGNVDMLHMDISNDGDKLKKTLELWGSKMSKNGVIAFEGGSKERDDGWIKKYGHEPIRKILLNDPIIKDWNVQIFTPYPSLTLLWKRNGTLSESVKGD